MLDKTQKQTKFQKLTEAFVIAYLGGFSIEVRYFDDYKQAQKEYLNLREYYKCVQFKKDGDLIVELTEPEMSQALEPIQVTMERVNKAVSNPLPPLEIDAVGQNFLDVVSKRLLFTSYDQQLVIRIAQVIARIEGKKVIETSHLAMSCLYRSHTQEDNESIIVAEDSALHFGPFIHIEKQASLSRNEHLKAAITHLQALLHNQSQSKS